MTLPHHYRSVGWSWSNVSCTTSLWSVVCHFALSHNTVRMCVLTQWWDQTAGVCVLLQTLRPLHVWQPPVFPFCLYWYNLHLGYWTYMFSFGWFPAAVPPPLKCFFLFFLFFFPASPAALQLIYFLLLAFCCCLLCTTHQCLHSPAVSFMGPFMGINGRLPMLILC